MRARSLTSLAFAFALVGAGPLALAGCDSGSADAAGPDAPAKPAATTAVDKIGAPATEPAAATTAAPATTGAPAATAAPAAGDPAPATDGLAGIVGINLEGLTKARRMSAGKMFQTEASACGKPHSLATSLREDAACRDSIIIAQYIVDELRKGLPESNISAAVADRVKELKVREISIEGRPVFGNPRAPVTIVVFADFECPHCAAEAPKLQEAVRNAKGKAKLVFRHFPLNGHDRGRRVALATEAALAQNNEAFWAVHNAAFANQAQLVSDAKAFDAKVRGYAEAAKLDMKRFDDHMEFKRGEAILEADKAAGEVLGIQGTPAVYINGREWTPYLFGGDLNAWIADAANRPAG